MQEIRPILVPVYMKEIIILRHLTLIESDGTNDAYTVGIEF